jgi:hypothetical protein
MRCDERRSKWGSTVQQQRRRKNKGMLLDMCEDIISPHVYVKRASQFPFPHYYNPPFFPLQVDRYARGGGQAGGLRLCGVTSNCARLATSNQRRRLRNRNSKAGSAAPLATRPSRKAQAQSKTLPFAVLRLDYMSRTNPARE